MRSLVLSALIAALVGSPALAHDHSGGIDRWTYVDGAGTSHSTVTFRQASDKPGNVIEVGPDSTPNPCHNAFRAETGADRGRCYGALD